MNLPFQSYVLDLGTMQYVNNGVIRLSFRALKGYQWRGTYYAKVSPMGDVLEKIYKL